MLLDYARLEPLMLGGAAAYRAAEPFPHIVVDEFLPPETVAALLPHFPPPARRGAARGWPARLRGRRALREDGAGVALSRLCWELSSLRFVSLLEAMTGIEHLLPDPHLLGGGVQQAPPGGFLRVHADFGQHPETRLDCRLNLLVYFNPGWRERWGGHLELWDRDVGEAVRRIAPLAGRCVIFNTTSVSFHGQPRPLACPEGVTRKSVALHYYSNGRPASELGGGEHSHMAGLEGARSNGRPAGELGGAHAAPRRSPPGER